MCFQTEIRLKQIISVENYPLQDVVVAFNLCSIRLRGNIITQLIFIDEGLHVSIPYRFVIHFFMTIVISSHASLNDSKSFHINQPLKINKNNTSVFMRNSSEIIIIKNAITVFQTI